MDKGTKHKGLGYRDVRGRRRQRGAVLALVAVGMLAIIGMAGLALQSGHLFVNKTHLQNALDAAALSAAKTLNNDGTVEQAEAAGREAFDEHLPDPESGDGTFVETQLGDSTYTLAFEFSAALAPFVGGADETDDPPATFVRARATGVTMNTWLANVLPGVGNQQDIGGTAVAGPVPIDTAAGETCDILPLLICAKPGAAPDCNETECYGFPVGEENELCLKSGAPGQGGSGGGGGGCDPFAPGTGNFQLLDLECPEGGGGGGACIRKQLAGEYRGCAKVHEGEPVETAPGDKVGPAVQGINTRFGEYQGAGLNETDHPPDVVTYNREDNLDFWHDGYVERTENGPHDNTPIDNGGTGVRKRREIALPIGDCTAPGTGVTNVPVLEVACFYLTKPAKQGGPGGGNGEIYGQLTKTDCEADGEIATEPPPGGGGLLYRIVLYKDPDSRDS